MATKTAKKTPTKDSGVTFSQLKKRSSRKTNIEKLTKEFEAAKQGSQQEGVTKDSRFWVLSRDKSGNGSAIIRFLDAPHVDGNNAARWIRYWDHGFKGPSGAWYIEKCLTSIEQECPVCKDNRELWNSGIEANQDIVRGTGKEPGRKRRLYYVSNILVIKDPSNPENNGKHFLYRYGAKIHEKNNMAAIPPQDELEETPIKPVNVFDFWHGANFKLRIRKTAHSFTYDESTFADPSPLFEGDDAKIEELWKSLYSLQKLLDPSEFKSYEALIKRLRVVLDAADMSFPTEATTEELKEEGPPKIDNVVDDGNSKTEETPEPESTVSEDDLQSDVDYYTKLVESEE